MSQFNKFIVYCRFVLAFLYFFFFLNKESCAQTPIKTPIDSVSTKDTTISVPTSSGGLDDVVNYESYDSIWFDLKAKEIHLYRSVVIKYKEIVIEAGYVVLNFDKNTINAKGILDSLGNVVQNPVFKDGGQTYGAKEIVYNYQSKKAVVSEVVTKLDQNYLIGEKVKMINESEAFLKNGKFTTCSQTEDPHYYLAITKAKMIKDDKIVAGPSYIVIEGVPLPIGLPFALLPAQKGKSSGLIMPMYGNSPQLGLFLRDLGYYQPISENMDLRLYSDIYSFGSWRLKASSFYTKRYKFNGNVSMSFSNTRFGEKGDLDFSSQRDFLFNWNFNQDPKASTKNRFNANVTAGSSNFIRNNSFTTNAFLNNSLNSSVAWTRLFPEKPYILSITASHSQNTQTKAVNITLPNATFTVNRLNPFLRKVQIGTTKWYEKIGVSYTANAQASLSGADSTLFKGDLGSKVKTGILHSIPVSTSFSALKYVTVTPSVNYREWWYFQRIESFWEPDSNKVLNTTRNDFYALREYGASISMNTRLYGTFQFKSGPISAIRHSMNPSVGLSIRPDFSAPNFGYYSTYQSDALGNTRRYSFYQSNIFGGPAGGKQAAINYSLDNVLEMKVKKHTDSATTFKKVKIFDSFLINGSYNGVADSLRWSAINLSGRTTFSPNLSTNFGAVLNPYLRTDNGTVINDLRIQNKQGLASVEQFFFTLSGTIRSKNNKPEAVTPTAVPENSNAWIDFTIPYTVNFNYNVQVSKALVKGQSSQIIQVFTFNGDVNLTPKWKIGYNTGYDLTSKKVTPTIFNLYRDLHCWEMSINVVPFGYNQSYTFTLNVKAQALRDLRITRRRDWYDYR